MTRVVSFSFVLVAALSGCGLIVGLGDPKEYAEPGRPGSGTSLPRGTQGSVQAQQIALAPDHGCAIINVGLGSPDNGSVRCWGGNAQGQLGVTDPSIAMSAQPLEVDPFPEGFMGASQLALGLGASCAISVDDYLVCWGGLAGLSDTGVHRVIAGPASLPSTMRLGENRDIAAVAAATLNGGGGCALEGLSLVCWGTLAFSAGPDAGAPAASSVSDPVYVGVSAGGGHACAIAERDNVRDVECWGDNTYGQAGPMIGTSSSYPVALQVGPDVKAVAAGGAFTCALFGNGSVSCWGRNERGQLGLNGPPGLSGTPVVIPFENGLAASAITAGDGHVCALMSDPAQSVECWGDGRVGQLGRGADARVVSATPKRVQRVTAVAGHEDLPHVIAVAASGDTTCIVSSTDAEVTCWGRNDLGQAGQPPGAPVDVATAVAW